MSFAVFSGVRARLVALLLAAAIPFAVVAAASAWHRHDQALARLEETAALLGEADRVRHRIALDDLEALVRGLAGFGDVPAMPAAECRRILKRLRELSGPRYANLWFLDPAGGVHCDAEGAAEPPLQSGQAHLRRLRDGADHALGDFIPGPGPAGLMLPAAAPMRDGAGVIAFAVAAIRADWFIAEAEEAEAPAHHTWLLDPGGRAFALAGRDPALLPAAQLHAALLAAPAGERVTRVGESAGGAAFAYSLGPADRGMRVLVGLPATEAREQAQSQFRARLTELALFLLACLLVVLAGTELSCARPLRRLAAQVRSWRPGAAFRPRPTAWDPWEVRALSGALNDASVAIASREAGMGAALAQRDHALREVHHRVKNNLQIVASLLSLQEQRLSDPAARLALEAARWRVQALSTLHRHLDVREAGAVVPVAPLLEELAAQLVDGPGVTASADPLLLPAEQATSLALLVAEGLGNAARHAFPPGRPGEVTVTLRVEAGRAALTIRDNGQGPPPGRPEGLGLTLLRGYAAHLGGEARFEGNAAGSALVVVFPVPADASPQP